MKTSMRISKSALSLVLLALQIIVLTSTSKADHRTPNQQKPALIEIVGANCRSSFDLSHSNCIEVKINSAKFMVEINENTIITTTDNAGNIVPLYFVWHSHFRSYKVEAFKCGQSPFISCSGIVENTRETVIDAKLVNMDSVKKVSLQEALQEAARQAVRGTDLLAQATRIPVGPTQLERWISEATDRVDSLKYYLLIFVPLQF